MDEFRLTNICRSEGWINTEYNNQHNPSTFYSIGIEYTVSGNPRNEHYFKYYKEIIIDHTMVSGSHDLIDFPLLISTFDEDLKNKAQYYGYDIAFAYNGAWLDHEIEFFDKSYNTTHAQLIAWVQIPRLSTTSDTTFRMYYGNSSMNSRENPNGVWNNEYKGVWHLSETTGSALDSTNYGISGTVSGTVTRNQTGKISTTYDFGSNGQIYFGNPPDNHFNMGTESFTISFWMNIDASTGNYQLPLYKGATVTSETGYDFETSTDADVLFFRITDGTNLAQTTVLSIEFDEWIYVTGVVDRTLDLIHLFGNGLPVGSGVSIASIGNIDNDLGLVAPSSTYDLNGLLDEIRIIKSQRSADWILTEYNNQNDPQSFLTISTEERFDTTPPTYSGLIESSDPLELGDTEIITINITDPSGINQVKIEFMASNHSMTNIGGDRWQYNSWTPNSVNNYTYKIFMQDNYNNWNTTQGIIEVIDTTPPTFSDLIESADNLQLGQNETITIKVYDSPGSGVNQVLLEYDSLNQTMNFAGGDTWSWNKWRPFLLGIHSYKIYMQDMENNWNMTSGSIRVVDTTAPIIENLTESEDPLELGGNITINIDVFDSLTSVSSVLIELEGTNHTMNNIGGSTYEYNFTSSYVGITYYIIYANDTENNWNSLTSSFDIIDTTPPAFANLSKSEDPLEFGSPIIISINCTDLSNINQVMIEIEGVNNTMINIEGNRWQYELWIPSITGNCFYTIWAEDNNNNWNSINDSVLVQDTTPPLFSGLTESTDPVEFGTPLTISINCTDLAGIKRVSIEYENFNHTMIYMGGITWQYDSWTPSSVGNYSYIIWIEDSSGNLNFATGSILFQDTILPVYFNSYENMDPLELGDSVIIRIDIYDFAGINQTIIEFEGSNHSMTNIYGNTWQYDSWTPRDWILYQYCIYMEDYSGNWNSMKGNITVQDTTPPSPPVLTNNPSGEVSGILVFDWLDGTDPSGISYYVLIIDNETDPLVTPGYTYIFNITNEGSESSYFKLPEILPDGTYYFFLTQVDGVGRESGYTMGTFTVISLENGNPANMNLIIMMVILASVIGSVVAIVIVRKKAKKNISPPREKIPLKIISSHINKLSLQQPPLQEKIQNLAEKGEIDANINDIKYLGEQLFAEGAYLEAMRQFKLGRDYLLNLGREEEAKLFSELISGIEGLMHEREKRLELLEKFKVEGNTVQIFELYQDIIVISKKLRDPDTASFYQAEIINYFQTNKLNFIDLEDYRFELNQKALSLIINNKFEIAALQYEKCEKISQLFVQIGREEEIANIEEFRLKKEECLRKF
jgi:hypothetical protein